MDDLVRLVGYLFFGIGVFGLYGIYVYGVTRIERVVISICAFVIGGVSLISGEETEARYQDRMEIKRWEIAHCYGPSSVTEYCVPSMVDGKPVTE